MEIRQEWDIELQRYRPLTLAGFLASKRRGLPSEAMCTRCMTMIRAKDQRRLRGLVVKHFEKCK